jgi:cytoplasmic iron level regulating protein YaaA (DUF328/UPF0246 family)
MLILLPPSETKADGGTGPALDLDTLSFPTLTPVRSEILDDLSSLTDKDADARSRLAVGSALFGVVRADDLIPHYRLSSGTKLPVQNAGRGTGSAVLTAVPTLKKRWGRLITEALQCTPDGSGDGVIVDLRSGGYQGLGKVPAAVTVRVESVRPDGSRKVVSHFNKHYKGVLARVLATAGADADAARTAADVAAIAESAGMTVETNEAVGGKAPKDTLTLVV